MFTIVKRKDGWWLVGFKDGFEHGPYWTKAGAESDRQTCENIERFRQEKENHASKAIFPRRKQAP